MASEEEGEVVFEWTVKLICLLREVEVMDISPTQSVVIEGWSV